MSYELIERWKKEADLLKLQEGTPHEIVRLAKDRLISNRKAAKALGLSESTIRRRIKLYQPWKEIDLYPSGRKRRRKRIARAVWPRLQESLQQPPSSFGLFSRGGRWTLPLVAQLLKKLSGGVTHEPSYLRRLLLEHEVKWRRRIPKTRGREVVSDA
jgi:transposase